VSREAVGDPTLKKPSALALKLQSKDRHYAGLFVFY
jgi:hypothetical protein